MYAETESEGKRRRYQVDTVRPLSLVLVDSQEQDLTTPHARRSSRASA